MRASIRLRKEGGFFFWLMKIDCDVEGKGKLERLCEKLSSSQYHNMTLQVVKMEKS